MKIACMLTLLIFPFFASAQKSRQPLKVKIEATALDRQMIIEKLNSHGEGHHLKFELSDGEFDYRIVFSTSQTPTNTAYGAVNSSTAMTSLFDSKGSELFEFKREGRWTDSGATNAAAKEIIKRLLKLGFTSK
jgi:hypothetical protein